MATMSGKDQHPNSIDQNGSKPVPLLPIQRVGADERDWFTPATLAKRLKVSERLIRKWVSQGRLRSYKIDGCRRFDPVDVAAFLAQFSDQGGRSDE